MSSSAQDGPLFRFNRDRNHIIDEVVERVTRDSIRRAWESPADGLDYLLNEAAYLEVERLERLEEPPKGELEYWRRIARSLGRASEEENAERLREIVTRFTHDIVGHFRPNVFRFATQVLPPSLSLLLGKRASSLWVDPAQWTSLRGQLRIEGEVGKLRRLAEVGTLVFVPTHASHLDSILVSWAIHESGLPAVVHGAQQNLFAHPLMSFFMDNLGAYKVNRRRRFRLYRRVLKTYSQVLLESGYHSLFFPSGQRSRSGRIEQNLKLGLLSTAIEAYAKNVVDARTNANIYVVPVTVNYSLVLEAHTLVTDELADASARRPIIEDDEFGDVRRISAFAREMIAAPSPITIRFCTPMDVFGNAVDQDGQSVDDAGRRVDPERYLWEDGTPTENRGRERAYTRQLAGSIVEAFLANNVIQPLHIVAFALVEHLRRQHPSWDLPRIVRFARGDSVARSVVEGETERVMRLLRRDHDEERLRLSRRARSSSAKELVDEALQLFGAYHREPLAVAEGTQIRMLDLALLYYYANRLRGYDLVRRMRSVPGGY